jgi:hypothetical protein
MKLIEKAVSHFSTKSVREIYVDEWETKLFAKPLSLEERSRLFGKGDGNNIEYMVNACIHGLLDDKGEKVFDIGDKPKLMKAVDPEIVTRLALFVLNTEADSEEEREKN